MKSIADYMNETILMESKYVTFDASNIDKMSDDELWAAFEEAAAAKAACALRKDKKGEEELAEIIAQIRKKLN